MFLFRIEYFTFENFCYVRARAALQIIYDNEPYFFLNVPEGNTSTFLQHYY